MPSAEAVPASDDLLGVARVDVPTLVDDLEQEQAALDDVLDAIGPEAWERATPAEGWSVRDTVAHLAQGEELASLAVRDGEAFQARLVELVADLEATLEQFEAWSASTSSDQLLTAWRSARAELNAALRGLGADDRVPWVVGSMGVPAFARARLMECWAHGLDIVDGLGVERPDEDRRLRHVCQLGLRTRAFSFTVHGQQAPPDEVRLELDAPSGARWTSGPREAGDRIAGTAWDFAAVVTQRRNPEDTSLVATGEGARAWLRVAQCFAGPPTDHRPAGTFDQHGWTARPA